jgi:hypothetical protein
VGGSIWYWLSIGPSPLIKLARLDCITDDSGASAWGSSAAGGHSYSLSVSAVFSGGS